MRHRTTHRQSFNKIQNPTYHTYIGQRPGIPPPNPPNPTPTHHLPLVGIIHNFTNKPNSFFDTFLPHVRRQLENYSKVVVQMLRMSKHVPNVHLIIRGSAATHARDFLWVGGDPRQKSLILNLFAWPCSNYSLIFKYQRVIPIMSGGKLELKRISELRGNALCKRPISVASALRIRSK